MKKSEVTKKIETKSVQISIRTTISNSDWMRENKISPSAVFQKALEELKSE